MQVSGLPENTANKCQSHDLNLNLLFFLSHEAGRLQRQGRVSRVVSAELWPSVNTQTTYRQGTGSRGRLAQTVEKRWSLDRWERKEAGVKAKAQGNPFHRERAQDCKVTENISPEQRGCVSKREQAEGIAQPGNCLYKSRRTRRRSLVLTGLVA